MSQIGDQICKFVHTQCGKKAFQGWLRKCFSNKKLFEK